MMALSSPRQAGAERAAVLGVGPCSRELGTAVRAVRSAAAHRLDVEVLSEAATQAPFQADRAAALAEVDALISEADESLHGGDLARSRPAAVQAVERLLALPPSASRWSRLRTADTLLAWVALKAEQPEEARQQAEAVLTVEPSYRPSPDDYPPIVQDLFREVARGVSSGAPMAATEGEDLGVALPCFERAALPRAAERLSVSRVLAVARESDGSLTVQGWDRGPGPAVRIAGGQEVLDSADTEAIARLLGPPRPPSLAPVPAPVPPAVATSAAPTGSTGALGRRPALVAGGASMAALLACGGFAVDRQLAVGSLQSHASGDGRGYQAGSQGAVGALLNRRQMDQNAEIATAIGSGVLAVAAGILWVASDGALGHNAAAAGPAERARTAPVEGGLP
jgi:hypothetical protein